MVVRQLVALGVTPSQLPEAMRDQGWPMSRTAARGEYDAVLAEWVEEHAGLRDKTRVAQVERLSSDLARYRRDGKWQATVQTEALLARILGHLAPQKVEVAVEASVVVKGALLEVVAGLSAEDVERLLEEEAAGEELERDRRALVVSGEAVAGGG